MNTIKNNFVFMAFGKGSESKEAGVIKRYVGVAPVNILAVNPNKAKLEELYDITIENEPEYISEITVGEDNHKVKNVRIDFIVKTVADKCNGIDFTSKITFFMRNEYRYNRDKSKVQVIDKYGRTAWVTVDQFKAKEIPMYSNGPANLDKDYRACYFGEEELTNFIKLYLNIPSVMNYVNGKWVMVDNPSDSEARLENVANYFNGNFKELNAVINLQPNNKIKALFGVRTNEDKQYQTVYTQMFLRNNATNYSKLDADLQERKANGAYPTTEFFIGDLKEYTVEATDFNKEPSSDLPFAPESSDNPWGFN